MNHGDLLLKPARNKTRYETEALLRRIHRKGFKVRHNNNIDDFITHTPVFCIEIYYHRKVENITYINKKEKIKLFYKKTFKDHAKTFEKFPSDGYMQGAFIITYYKYI